MQPSAEQPRVAYVAYAFPVLTQTFTVREVAALREHGLDVEVFALRRDPDAALDPEGVALAASTRYLPGPLSPSTLCSALGWLLRRPVRSAATLLACLGGGYADDALRCRLRAPLHFLVGTALAASLRRDGRFTRVHAQFVDAGSTVAFVASRLAGVPLSFTNHTAYNPYLLPVKARCADAVVSISLHDVERVVAECGESVRARTVVNRVGIRLDEWTGLVRSPEPGRVLSVGALREKKGHDVLVRAAGILARRGVKVDLRFAGGGAGEPALRELARTQGVDVAFLGPVGPDVVLAELGRAAVFVLPCRLARNGDLDGIPVALMEAMAAGVPVVSTRLSGIPELVEDGISGRLAEPGDAQDLARVLGEVLADPAAAEALAAAGRVRVAELHDLRRTSRTLAAILSGGAR